MSLDENINDTETCPRCLLEVLLAHPHHTDEYDGIWHTHCWENEEQSQAERAFERSLQQ